jgi:hypothetical protein
MSIAFLVRPPIQFAQQPAWSKASDPNQPIRPNLVTGALDGRFPFSTLEGIHGAFNAAGFALQEPNGALSRTFKIRNPFGGVVFSQPLTQRIYAKNNPANGKQDQFVVTSYEGGAFSVHQSKHSEGTEVGARALIKLPFLDSVVLLNTSDYLGFPKFVKIHPNSDFGVENFRGLSRLYVGWPSH